jgi:hypothetical protein
LKKHLAFLFGIFKGSRFLQNAKENLVTVLMDLEPFQRKATHFSQLTQQNSTTCQMTRSLDYTAARISKHSDVLTQVQQKLK